MRLHRKEVIRLGGLCGFFKKGNKSQKREKTKKMGFGFLGLKNSGEVTKKYVRKLMEDEDCFKFPKFLNLKFL